VQTEADGIIAEYQRTRREFRRRFERLALVTMLPGFLLFMLGPFRVTRNPIPILGGFGLFVFGLARGYLLSRTMRCCPACGAWQAPGYRVPYRTCYACGTQLSRGVTDSS
jgi:hypothetical protein